MGRRKRNRQRTVGQRPATAAPPGHELLDDPAELAEALAHFQRARQQDEGDLEVGRRQPVHRTALPCSLSHGPACR